MSERRELRKLIGYPSFDTMDEPEIFTGLRKLARECGFNIKRGKGGYQLLKRGAVIAGDRQPLDIEELAREMLRRHIIGGAETVRLPVSERRRKWG
jgi:hypothetical protein